MSIVSKKIDTFAVPRDRHGPVKAVGFVAGDPQYAPFAQPAQKAWFNLSKSIAKPFVAPPEKHYKPGVVPLKSLQYGTHAGAVLFNAPVMIDIAPLKTEVPRPTYIHVEDATQEVHPQFPDYSYLDGVRPYARALKPEEIIEPTGPTFRPSAPVYRHQRVQPVPTAYLPDDEIVRQVRSL
jgi:hypothetical protein